MRKLLYLMLLLPFFMVAQENESFLLNMTLITVKHDHEAQFVEGVKAWKACYLENKGEDNWNVWRRVQGKGTVYGLTGVMAKWAEMDEDNDEAGKACRMTVINLIRPHIESIEYNIARSMPDISKKSPMSDETSLVWVHYFKIKNSTLFMEVINETTAAIKKEEGDSRGTWYRLMGGSPDVADYFVSIPFKNFADLDTDRDGVWKIHEKVNGQAKTDATRNKMRDALSSEWSYMYTLNKELSN